MRRRRCKKEQGTHRGRPGRVIILRALLKLPIFGPEKNAPDPKAAFAPAALAPLPPEDARRYGAEGRLWDDVARGPHLTPAQTDADAATLRATPNIRWWLSPGLAVLYQSQGNPAAAQRFLAKARSQALLTMGPLGAMQFYLGRFGVRRPCVLVLSSVSAAAAALALASARSLADSAGNCAA